MDKLQQWNRQELLQSSLFEPLHSVLLYLESTGFPELTDLNELLAKQSPIWLQSGKQLAFVEQMVGKPGFESQYEPRCYLSGEVQSRDHNYHDLFNALVWLIFPRGKAALNALHYRALTEPRNSADSIIDGAVLNSQRGRTRDMGTLFDESGVVIACANADLTKLLFDFKWQELFWLRREEVKAQMGFYLFGHGLYEKAINPYTGLTGQGLVLPVKVEFFTWNLQRRIQYLDERVALYLDDPSHCRHTRELTPVPLLGIPGWSAENECPEYYENQNYFRPGRRKFLSKNESPN
jgi:hypothetical protein